MSTAVRHERSRRINRELITTWAIVAVLMAYFALRHFYPTLFAFFVSFNKYDLLTGAFSFVGIDNYIDTFTDQRSLRSIANTSIYVVGNVVGDTLLGLTFALLLDRLGKGSVVLRTIYFMPVVVSVVALSQLWIWIYHRDLGLLNWALSMVGIGKIGWLVDTRYALSSIIIMNVWREMGFALVIFMAGLKTIPEHFYDAARVDGASAWQVARRVTIPLLTPITLLVVVVNTIGAFKGVHPGVRDGPARGHLFRRPDEQHADHRAEDLRDLVHGLPDRGGPVAGVRAYRDRGGDHHHSAQGVQALRL